MRLAALLAKAVSGRANVLPAHAAVHMATLSGAQALGLEGRIGSIVPGKQADLTAVNLSSLSLSPCYHPVSHLVYCAGATRRECTCGSPAAECSSPGASPV